MTPKDTDTARFANYVSPEPNTGCWLWTGAVAAGYGVFWFAGRNEGAHRFAFLVAHGRLPAGVSRHVCNTQLCVNPAHVLEGTQAQNIADKVVAQRQAKGKAIGSAVLSAEQVVQIRARYASGNETHSTLAAAFGVDRTNIYAILNRKTWRHL